MDFVCPKNIRKNVDFTVFLDCTEKKSLETDMTGVAPVLTANAGPVKTCKKTRASIIDR